MNFRFLHLLLALIETDAGETTSGTQCSSEAESCKETLTGNALLQAKTNVMKIHKLDAEQLQGPTDAYSFTDENGYPIGEYEKDGYVVKVNVSWAGTGAHLYHHVKDTDMCNALCLKEESCKGFIFHHEPEAEGHYKCYLVTSQGQGMYYHPCCHVGIPDERSTTTTTTTAKAGLFTISYTESLANEEHTAMVKTQWCMAEIDSQFVSQKCELAKPEMNWEKSENGGYYVNAVSGKCMGFGKVAGNTKDGMAGLLIPLDPSELADPAEECAYLDSRKLKIGIKYFDAYTKKCYQQKMGDNLNWWFQCTIAEQFEDFTNEGYDSKRYLTAYDGTLTRSWTETEVSAALLQHASIARGASGEAGIWDCRKMAQTTCPTVEMVKETPAGNRHKCWDAVSLPWWGKCRCNLGGQGCGGGVPCLVKILEVVEDDCLNYDVIADTSSDSSIGEGAAM